MKNIGRHPCFNEQAHEVYGRIHLPVAPKCNIQCRYCIRSLNETENRPGVACRIVSPDEALAMVREAAEKFPLTVVGVAGPGDALANEETFETFRLVDREFPDLMKCISTNGLALPGSIDKLKEIKLDTLTVTVNAVDPKIAAGVYEAVFWRGRRLEGLAGAKILVRNQLEGVKKAVEAGMFVKINTVLIPGVNMDHTGEIAKKYAKIGVNIMNIMPLIPLYKLKDCRAPDCVELQEARVECEKFLPQFRKCKQCRADAVGVPGCERKGGGGRQDTQYYYHF
ncbi:MAG: radical SAM protein [Candidatus Altiarchaeota archaeon]|nr:radical SAM protein [Candidatus Altiarchaeota archaeon]